MLSDTRCRVWSPGLILAAMIMVMTAASALAQDEAAPMSDATAECLACHEMSHPGIVAGWQASRHAGRSFSQGVKVSEGARRVSAQSVPQHLANVSVGCAECHTIKPSTHKDTVEHNGYEVHTVVTPEDCAVCHPVERDQYSRNIMAWARKNLAENPVYEKLIHSVVDGFRVSRKGMSRTDPPDTVMAESCFSCHGTEVAVTGTEIRETDMGEMEFAVLTGWPNQGTGRVNPDGSRGACSACHPRHGFRASVARKPHTCRQCHVGPDVPAAKVYAVSKHGNLYESDKAGWNFEAMPWTVGTDFTAPTCAVCHISRLESPTGDVVATRTHQMNDRLRYRLFGVVYAHAHPKSPDTTIIRNKSGLPLPADLDMTFATEYLIDEQEQMEREERLAGICLSCHSRAWTQAHFDRLATTVSETNHNTLAATRLMEMAWLQGVCAGLSQGENPFDEPLERTWVRTWLFYANSTRLASAMAGGGDYGVFAKGRFDLSTAIFELNKAVDTPTGPRRE